jgi:hypothetical protein
MDSKHLSDVGKMMLKMKKGQPRQGHMMCWSPVGLQFSFL